MATSNEQLQLLRRNSRAKITLALQRSGPMSRSQLVGATGLSVACVGKVVNELIADRELVEVGNSVGRLGRPKSNYDINTQGALAAGVLLSAGSVRIAVANRKGEKVVEDTALYSDYSSPSDMMEAIAARIRGCVSKTGERPEALTGVGVSVAGTTDPLLGVIRGLTNRQGWEGVPAARILGDQLGVPVFLDNNARAAALHARLFGRNRGEGGEVYLYVGEGIGGAYVDDRGLLRGVHDSAGFFGHMTIEPDGPACSCGGRGCLEAVASDFAFIRGIWPDKVKGASELTFADRFQMVRDGMLRARRGDLDAARALRNVTRYIGIGVANIVSSLDPRTVHIYGTMTDIDPDHVVDLIRREAMRRVWRDARGVEIVALANHAEFLMRGAVGMVLSQPYELLHQEVNEVSAMHGSASLR